MEVFNNALHNSSVRCHWYEISVDINEDIKDIKKILNIEHNTFSVYSLYQA